MRIFINVWKMGDKFYTQFTLSTKVPALKDYLPKTRTVLLRSCCTAPLLCLFHLLFVLRLAITQSSASETVGSQPQ